jgi:hypothetical protein
MFLILKHCTIYTLPSKSSYNTILLKLTLATLLLFTAHMVQGQTKKLSKTYYSNGTLKEKGWTMEGNKIGVWYYYDSIGVLQKKEKWKNELQLWQLYYKRGKIIKTIDKNGKETKRPDCGC